MKRWTSVYLFATQVTIMAVLCPAVFADEFRVAAWNLEWFFDHDASDDSSTIGRDFAAPEAQEFSDRVETFADAIQQLSPSIIALQEVENRKVVQAIANRLAAEHHLDYKVAFVQGRDRYTGQDVAYLVKQDIPFTANRFSFAPFRRNRDFKDLSKHLKLEVTVNGEPITLVTVHLITKLNDRLRQAQTLRGWVEALVPTKNLIVLGDFNTGLRFDRTTPTSEMGIIRGLKTSDTTDDLFDVHQLLDERATHVSGREFDRILVSPPLRDNQGLKLVSAQTRRDLTIRGSADNTRAVDYARSIGEQDLSDHFPIIAVFSVPESE